MAAATVAVIRTRDEILVCERARDPYRGLFDLPGGFLDPGESAEAGLVRELKEELGLDVAPKQLRYLFSYPNIYPYDGIVYQISDSYFEVRFQEKPRVGAADDVASVRWVPLESIDFDLFAFASLKEALMHYRSI